MASSNDEEIRSHIEKIVATQLPNSAIYNFLLSGVRIHSATRGNVKARLVLTRNHVNSRGGIHGAVSAAVVDWAGGMAIAATGLEKTGVSTDIHVAYVSAARLGEVLEIEAWANKVGKTLSYTQVEIRKLGTGGQKGEVICTGTHTKYLKFT